MVFGNVVEKTSYVGEMLNYEQLVGGKLGGQCKTQLHKPNNITYIINHNSDPSVQYNTKQYNLYIKTGNDQCHEQSSV